MKRNAIIRICIYSLLLILLLCLLLSGINGFRGLSTWLSRGDRGEWGDGSLTAADKPRNFDASAVSSLEIDWAVGDILIQHTDAGQIMVSEQRGEKSEPMVVSCKNGRLKIEYSEGGHVWFGIHNNIPSKNLTISLPKGWTGEMLDVDMAGGSVKLTDMTFDEMEFDGASAELTLENCTLRTLDIDAASGSVSFSGSLDVLDMDGASADFTGVFENKPFRLTVDGMSGSLDITLPTDCGFTANLDGLSSSFNCDLPVSTRNGAYIAGDGSCKIDADGMSMTVTVRYAE